MKSEVVLYPSGTKAFTRTPLGVKSENPKEHLNKVFLETLKRDFVKYGKGAIQAVREKRPDKYIELIASLLPKETNVNVSRANHLDISVSATTEFIRDAIRGSAAGASKKSVQDGLILPAEIRVETPGHGAPVDLRESEGGSGEAERVSGSVVSRSGEEQFGNSRSDDTGSLEQSGIDGGDLFSHEADSEGVSEAD